MSVSLVENPLFLPYSPKCLEGVFSEDRTQLRLVATWRCGKG
jgi:hypothetical protein